MKTKRFTEEQIAFVLRQAENGTAVADVCQKLQISEQTFCLSLLKTPSAFDPPQVAYFDPSESINYDHIRVSSFRGDRMNLIGIAVVVLRALLMPRGAIIAENLTLRHQLGILHRSAKQPGLRQWDRIFWAWQSRFWSDWRSALPIVQPVETAVEKCSAGRGRRSVEKCNALGGPS